MDCGELYTSMTLARFFWGKCSLTNHPHPPHKPPLNEHTCNNLVLWERFNNMY